MRGRGSSTCTLVVIAARNVTDFIATGCSYRQATTISVLPDNVLLDIFWLYKKERNEENPAYPVWKWHRLVHVCRRWRQVVFASPRRLDLRIRCTSGTPVREYLGIWPVLPIFIDYHFLFNRSGSNEDHIVAALDSEYLHRICGVWLAVTGSELERITRVMQEPFPVLTSLTITSRGGDAVALPAEFLGGYAPRLQEITLNRIPFPALPTLLLSTIDLITLKLANIPPTGYISPESMVVGLAALPRLKDIHIIFQPTTLRSDRIPLPPVTRSVLPALTNFRFEGASEYLEDLVSRIDVPQLNRFSISYLNQLPDFRVPQLPKFIDRSFGPKLALIKYARLSFSSYNVSFLTGHQSNSSQVQDEVRGPLFSVSILSHEIDWQVSHMAQVLSRFSTTLSNVVHLKLFDFKEDRQSDGTDNAEWLHLLHQFSAVKMLYVSNELAGHVALTLEGSRRRSSTMLFLPLS